ncbi:MAG: 50S ribosomal protein L21 [Candidatus Omnitrophica bacterium]|nr:50S ribosomal protein L21 [Candidatus Omnitrophota bacterium]
MYAIVQFGSHQYKIVEGDEITANRLSDEVGKTHNLDKILLYAKDKDIRIGQPFLKDVEVSAKVVSHDLGDKIVAFRYRKRKDTHRKVGHRQKLTTLKITKITAK